MEDRPANSLKILRINRLSLVNALAFAIFTKAQQVNSMPADGANHVALNPAFDVPPFLGQLKVYRQATVIRHLAALMRRSRAQRNDGAKPLSRSNCR